MRRLVAVVATLAALAACAPDLPDLEGEQGEEVAGARIDAEVVAAAQAAGLESCPGTSPAGTTELSGVTIVCVSSGEPVDLGAFAGKPVLVNVWAHWCEPCKEELPLLARAAEEYAGRVQFVGILFADERPTEAIALAEASGVTYPQLADPDSATRVPLGLRGFPQTVFLDADGTKVGTEYTAYRDYDDLTAAIESQLGVRQ